LLPLDALRRAVEAGDADRVARCTMDLKRLFLAESPPSTWALGAFPGLAAVAAAAPQGGGNGSGSSPAYSAVPLSAPLTRLQGPLAAAAVAISRSILAFTGELQVRRPPSMMGGEGEDRVAILRLVLRP